MTDNPGTNPRCRLIGGKSRAFKGFASPLPVFAEVGVSSPSQPSRGGGVRERSEQGRKSPTLPSPKTGRESEDCAKRERETCVA